MQLQPNRIAELLKGHFHELHLGFLSWVRHVDMGLRKFAQVDVVCQTETLL